MKVLLFVNRAVNYGAIGMVMGHELTHGFDNNGRQYDEYGNLHNWWDQGSADAFLNRTQCLINQYNRFKVGEKTVSLFPFQFDIKMVQQHLLNILAVVGIEFQTLCL